MRKKNFQLLLYSLCAKPAKQNIDTPAFRWQILLKGDKEKDINGKILKNAIQNAQAMFKKEHKSPGVRIAIDVDPVSII